MHRTRTLAVLGMSGALALVGAGAATAAAPNAQNAPGAQATARAPAMAALMGGSAARTLAATCYGQTDRPHRSSHVPGNVNVVARTVCPGFAVAVSTALYRDRWYGQQFLDSGSSSGAGRATTNAAWRCAGTGTYTYRAYSYHAAARHYPSRTYNSARFSC